MRRARRQFGEEYRAFSNFGFRSRRRGGVGRVVHHRWRRRPGEAAVGVRPWRSAASGGHRRGLFCRAGLKSAYTHESFSQKESPPSNSHFNPAQPQMHYYVSVYNLQKDFINFATDLNLWMQNIKAKCALAIVQSLLLIIKCS